MTRINGSLENEILKAVWMLEEDDEDVKIAVSQVQNILNDDGENNRAYTTIKTVMDRLVEKQLLVRYKEGKKFLYKSVSSRDEMAKTAIRKLAKQYFNNNMSSLMKAIEKECTVIKK